MMKNIKLATAASVLALGLAACGGGSGTTPPPSSYSLTVTVAGVAAAPIKVLNTTTGQVVWDNGITGSKTFSSIATGNVLKVEGRVMENYAVTSPPDVTLDASKAVTVTYAPLAGSAINSTVIQGIEQGATFPQARAHLINSQEIDTNNEGSVSPTGEVNLRLLSAPSADTFGTLLPTGNYGCVFQGTASGNPEISFWSEVGVLTADGDPLGRVSETLVQGGSVPGSTVARIYSRNDATVKGRVNCGPSSSGSYSLDLALKSGWNTAELVEGSSELSVRSLSAEARSSLRGYTFQGSVGVVLASAVNFGEAQTVQVPATFIQYGGYNGTVQLSTDIPGLTIEPSSISLPALKAQKLNSGGLGGLGMGAARVKTTLTFRYTGAGNLNQGFNIAARDGAGNNVGGGTGQLQVNRPGFTLGYFDAYDATVAPGKPLNLQGYVSGVGGFTGTVTLSAQNLPVGVTVTPTAVEVGAYSSGWGTIILTADTTVKPGTYTIQVVGTSGPRSATKDVTITVPKPTVSIALVGGYYSSYSTVALYPNIESSLEVDVTGEANFSGTTTLSFTGLPAGVSAPSKIITITPGATTRARLTLTATADAALGSTEVKLTSPDLTPSASPPSLTVSVRPARTAISSGSYIARSSAGVWQVTSAPYYATESKLTLSDATGDVRTVTVPGQVFRLVTAADGVLALSGDYNGFKSATLVKEDGNTITLPVPGLLSSDQMAPATDFQGRVWIGRTAYVSGGYSTQLYTWQPTTGEVVAVGPASATGYGYDRPFTLSNDGKTLVMIGGNSTGFLKINTVTGATTSVSVSGSLNGVAVANDGTVWYGTYGGLARINSDGTTTIFQTLNGGTPVGFDTQNSSILWGVSSGTVYRVDTASTTVKSVLVSDSYSYGLRVFTAQAGGVTVLSSESTSSGTVSYLSFIK